MRQKIESHTRPTFQPRWVAIFVAQNLPQLLLNFYVARPAERPGTAPYREAPRAALARDQSFPSVVPSIASRSSDPLDVFR